MRESGSLNVTLAAYPLFQSDIDELFKFTQIVAKMVELTHLPDHEAFKRGYQQWRADKAPMMLFSQEFLRPESYLVKAAQGHQTMPSGGSGNALPFGGANLVNSLSIEVMNFPHEDEKIWKNADLDSLEAHYAASNHNLFGSSTDDSLIQSVKNLLTVKDWCFVQIPPTKGFLRYCKETIGPGIRRFSGSQEGQISWLQFWEDWKKAVHCIHPRIASSQDKLKALVDQLDSPAKDKAMVYVASSDADCYWKCLRDLFFMYGNVQQQKQQAKALLQRLRPIDINSPEKNEEFFDQVKKLNLKMISLGISPERVGEDCMTVLLNNMKREYVQAFFMETHIGVSSQDTFYLTNSSAWYLRFCDWFNQFIRRQKTTLSERESWETAYSAQQLAASTSEQNGLQMSSKNTGTQQVAGPSVKTEAQGQVASIASEASRLEQTLLKIESVLSSQQAPNQSEQKRSAQKQKSSQKVSQSSDEEGADDKKEGKPKQGNGKKKQKRKNKCKFCDSTEHAMSKCPLTIEQRVQALFDKNMCSNCQYKGHVVADCRNNNTCHNCPGDQLNKHMTILCTRGGQQAPPAPAGQNGAGGAPPAPGQPQGAQ
jgi:hypothetical protein